MMKPINPFLCLVASLAMVRLCGAAPPDRAGVLSLEGPWLAQALLDQAGFEEWKGHGEGVRVHALRPNARPGDRYAEVLIDSEHEGKGKLALELVDVWTGETLGRRVEDAPKYPLLVRTDLRHAGKSEYLLRVVLSIDKQEAGRAAGVLRAEDGIAWSEDDRVAIAVSLPEGFSSSDSRVLTFGVPFPAGTLWSLDSLRMGDRDGRAIHAQWEVTGRWGENGSIKWVRADALIPLDAGEVYLKRSSAQPPHRPSSFQIEPLDGKRHEVTHDGYRYRIGPGQSPLESVSSEGSVLVDFLRGRGLFVVDQNGREARAGGPDTVVRVESEGPLAASFRVEGDYRTPSGQQLAHHITRLEFFAGQPGVRITHTFVVTEPTQKLWFRQVGWEGVPDEAVRGAAWVATNSDGARAEWTSSLGTDSREWTAAQIKHPRFRRGELLATIKQAGEPAAAWRGERIGDWAGLSGSDKGIFWVGQELARQHPKAFRLGREILALDLFSPEAGEELDFRAPAMVKRWRLEEWFPKADRERYAKKKGGELLDKIAGYEIDARGWAKTHELRLVPVPASRVPTAPRVEARLMTDPVFAVVSPAWIRRSRVMGPIHPRDPERFPAAEAFADAAFDHWHKAAREGGFDGFIDYWAGPTYNMFADRVRRNRFTYSLRADLWRHYARSGDRRAREFAVNTNRTYLDTMLAHAEPAQGQKGLYFYNNPHGEFRDATAGALPFVGSDSPTRLQNDGTTYLNQFWWLYQMTGYRRAKDAMEQMAAGALALKAAQADPSRPVTGGRRPIELQVWSHLYSYFWDPRLRLAAAEVTRTLYEPNGALKTITGEGTASTYKIVNDVRGLLTAWEVFGTAAHQEMLKATCEFIWQSQAGAFPISYTSAIGLAGHCLWEMTGDPVYPQSLAFLLRWASAGYNPKSERISLQGRPSVTGMTYILEGIPLIEDLLVRTDADRKQLTSWLAFALREGQEAKVFFAKRSRRESFSLRSWLPITNPAAPWREAPDLEVVWLDPAMSRVPPQLIRMSQASRCPPGGFRFSTPPHRSPMYQWELPTDVPRAYFGIDVSRPGEQYHLLGRLIPFVL